MTVATEVATIELAWTGVETSFATGIKVLAAAHLVVTYRDALGAVSDLVLNTHYSLALDGAGIATATPVALPAAPGTVIFTRVTPALQDTPFANLGSYAPTIHERLHDAAAMRSAEIAARVAALESAGDQTVIAADVAFTPAGGLAAADVQAALEELDAEKAPKASPTFTGTPAAPTAAPATSTTQLATTAFVVAEIQQLLAGVLDPVLADTQPLDPLLTAIAALVPADGDLILATNATAVTRLATTAFGRSLLPLANAAALRTLAGLVIGTDVQAYDADLAALAAAADTGLMARTAANTYARRTLVATGDGLAWTNADGVAGNPTIALDDDLAALEAMAGTGLVVRSGAGAYAQRSLAVSGSGIAVTNGDGIAGNPTIALADDMAAIEALTGTGFYARTGDGTAAMRSISAGPGLTVSNPTGTAGDPTVELSITTLAVDAAPDPAADYLLEWDASAATYKKTLVGAVAAAATAGVASFIGRTGAVVAAASDYDASQVDNDSTVTGAKVSDALNTLKNDKADLASPALTGNPTAPTQSVGNNSTRLATTAFVKGEIDVVKGGVSAAFDTLSEIATDLGLKMVKTANLSDVANAATAFGNIKQAATDSATGDLEIATDAEAQAWAASAQALVPSNAPRLLGPLKGLLWGLTLSNNVSDSTNDIDIAAGYAAAGDASAIMTLAAAITKRTDAGWAVGSGNGGLDDGTIADGTIHHYLIQRSDTGVVDVLQSLSPEQSGVVTISIATPAVVTWADHGLQVGSRFVPTTTGALPTGLSPGTVYYVISAGFGTGSFQVSATQGGAAINTSGTQSGTHTGTSAPKMPTSYDRRRRIGSLLRAAGAMVAFVQNGDEFMRAAASFDYDATNPGTSAITAGLAVPLGVSVSALVSPNITSTVTATSYWGLASQLSITDTAPTANFFNFMLRTGPSAGSYINSSNVVVRTNRSAQIRLRLNASTAAVTLRATTHGWIDARGRFE